MKLQICVLIVLAITIFLVGCGGINLEDPVWVLESYTEKGKLKDVLADTEITAIFNSTEKQVTGSGGCNNYIGGYEVKGRDLSIPGPIGTTEKSCGEEKDAQEREYLKTLEKADIYKIEDGKLTLYCKTDILYFRQK